MVKKKLKAVLVLVFGFLFLLLGLAGFVLPILQGWLFTAIGLILLSLYFPGLRAWVYQHTARWPKLHAMVEKVDAWAARTIGEL